MGEQVLRLPKSLEGRKGVILDTMVFIYLFEDTHEFGSVSEFIFEQTRAGRLECALTPISAAELMVKPIQKGRHDLADRYRFALSSLKNVVPLSLDFEAGLMAGSLKAKYGLPLPDMIQAALAMRSNIPTLITNDREMKRITEVEVFLLSDFL
ncbi:MAG: type II toxin-antitoxin system VapC family toxin [Desulfobacteraceae bacterium]|jgi:predicted nucleic acid-binding protein|nr:MAG: type II toxin-antitoxin system VapC family toxin [Desulfobacteraceae bacterium]